jgi:hypothetical protein
LHESFSSGLLQTMPRVVGGRYGLSSKEFNPAMIKGIFDEMRKDKPKNHFTIGINDDVTHTSLDYDRTFPSNRMMWCARCFTGWVQMERWAPTKTRSRLSASTPETTRRATTFTIRRSRARLRFRTCALDRSRFARRIW